VPDPHPEEPRSGVSKGEGHRRGLMVRDALRAPHHEEIECPARHTVKEPPMDKNLAAAPLIAPARPGPAKLGARPPDIVPTDEAEGYKVQRALHDLMRPQVGSLVGYKIGCTSKVMQEYLEIPHPCGGGVFEKGVHESGAKLAASDYVRVGVEC